MIETSNPEIDVNELMERVRREAAKIRERAGQDVRTGSARAARLLPVAGEAVTPPELRLSRPIEIKREKIEGILSRARKAIDVPAWMPKLFRGLARKQGGYDRALLELATSVAKTESQLNTRVQELATAAYQQNHWLRILAAQQAKQLSWQRAVTSRISELENLRQSVAKAITGGDQLREELSQAREEIEQQGIQQQTVREEVERQGVHLRQLHNSAEQQEHSMRGLGAQQQRDGEHIRHLQHQWDAGIPGGVEKRLAEMTAQAERAGEHLRHVQDQVDRGLQDLRTLRQDLSRSEERQVNDSIYLKGQLAQHGAVLQQGVHARVGKTQALPAEQQGAFQSHRLDNFYLSFENRFRGSRDEIKNRVRHYLPLLREASAGQPGRPILDVGCGRGEWLELLGEQGLGAGGVDLNHAMVSQCRERNLEVAGGDAVEHLRALPDDALGAVTGFHIIEHLPLETLIDLWGETRRVLKPDGLAIFESPNCKNLLVGASNFNLDPTHRNPVFPETAKFILESLGFDRLQLEYLSPVETSQVTDLEQIPATLRQLLYGPQDFAVIGRKPAKG